MLKLVISLLLIILLTFPVLTWWIAQRPIPVMEGLAEISGLSKPVLLRFDARAIPYISAQSEDDMYAAQGYAVARERMFQMDILRRQAEGRIAEVFGITALPNDRLMRTIGFERLAQAEMNHLSTKARNALESYSRGVNAYISEYGDRLPVEFTLLGYKPQTWRVQDSLALMKYLSYELDQSWKLDELRWQITNKVGDNMAARLFATNYVPSLAHFKSGAQLNSANLSNLSGSNISPKLILPELRTLAKQVNFLPESELQWGSTAFVLAPSLSKSGGAMLAADKHCFLSMPCQYFIISLSSPYTHCVGACLPGVPGIIFGRNEKIAWSSVNMHADVQDLFVEHFDSEFGNKYKTLSKIETADELHETIPVRFGKDVEHKITFTKHGPLLLRDKQSAVALSWTGFNCDSPWINSICDMTSAKSWQEYQQILSGYRSSPQLFLYADKQGNIASQAAGSIPLRAQNNGSLGTTVLEGWLARGQWVGTVPFSDLPNNFVSVNNKDTKVSDFVVAAGQSLLATAKDKNFKNTFEANYGQQFSPPYRANRLVLSFPNSKQSAKFDLLDLNALQGDEYSLLSRLVVNELKQTMQSNRSIDALQLKALEMMRAWDGCNKRDSAAAAIYESFISTLVRRLLEPKLGREYCNEYLKHWPLWKTFLESYLRQKPKEFLPPDERTYDSFMITTFAKSLTRIKLFFKSDKPETWSWSKTHLACFKEQGLDSIPGLDYIFDIKNVGLGGDEDCLNACDVEQNSVLGAFRSKTGPTVRLLIDMADDDAFYGNLALGQSGHRLSNFRQDQLKSWLKADPLPIAFSEKQVEKQAKQKIYIASPGYH